MTPEQKVRRVQAGVEMANSFGITAVIEPGVDGNVMAPIASLADAGSLSLRVAASLSPIAWHAGSFDEGVIDFLDTRDQWRLPDEARS
ncbi:MAG: hypothetical protein OEY74_02795 [Gammaproteobacteria bacterium]|nr:hypothetical protein [Gammaproteobacteria bacterium]